MPRARLCQGFLYLGAVRLPTVSSRPAYRVWRVLRICQASCGVAAAMNAWRGCHGLGDVGEAGQAVVGGQGVAVEGEGGASGCVQDVVAGARSQMAKPLANSSVASVDPAATWHRLIEPKSTPMRPRLAPSGDGRLRERVIPGRFLPRSVLR